jgi:monofunctional biosynthetic peptidoglycan transglycosylase
MTPRRTSRSTRWWRRLAGAALFLALLDASWLALLWPDFDALANGPIPKSAFIESYQRSLARGDEIAPLRWTPVPGARISQPMKRTAVIAEDARFFAHDGIDFDALKDALDANLDRGRIVLGGSTISQQTAKNLFLSPSRSPIRKWHELVLTRAMERRLSKNRILELYLNVAQFGQGVFGVEAAARHYWGISAAQISWRQAAELAAALPSPVTNNPATRTARFESRVRKILRFTGGGTRG